MWDKTHFKSIYSKRADADSSLWSPIYFNRDTILPAEGFGLRCPLYLQKKKRNWSNLLVSCTLLLVNDFPCLLMTAPAEPWPMGNKQRIIPRMNPRMRHRQGELGQLQGNSWRPCDRGHTSYKHESLDPHVAPGVPPEDALSVRHPVAETFQNQQQVKTCLLAVPLPAESTPSSYIWIVPPESSQSSSSTAAPRKK